MGRRAAAWLVVATVLLVLTAGCTGDSGDASSPPTRRFSFSDLTTGGTATPAPVPSGVPADLGTWVNPWPPGLNDDQVTAAQAALAAYQQYWSVTDAVAADPGADWTARVGQVATAEAGDDLLTAAQQMAAAGQHAIGPTVVNSIVTSVDGGIVTVIACVDAVAADVVDETGVSVRPPSGPGALWRYTSTAQVAPFNGGQWLVAVDDTDRSTRC